MQKLSRTVVLWIAIIPCVTQIGVSQQARADEFLATRLERIGVLPGQRGDAVPRFNFVSETDAWAYSQQSLWASEDAGRIWQPLPLPQTQSPYTIQAAGPESAHRGWIWIDKKAYYTNSGVTWTPLGLPKGQQNSSIAALSWRPGGVQGWALLAFGPLGMQAEAIYHTRDGGATWVQQWQEKKAQGPKYSLVLSGFFFPDSLRGVALGQYDVLVTNDGGKKWVWSQIHGDRSKNSDHHVIATILLQKRSGWLLFEDGSLFKTTDDGRSWHLLSQSGQIWTENSGLGQVNLFMADDSHGIVLGADMRPYLTHDGGRHWTRSPGGRQFVAMSCTAQSCWLSDEDRNLFRVVQFINR